MPRSTLPALAAIPAAGEGGARLPLLLDADGLPHDERVEFNGASPTGPSYRLLRDIEAWAVRSADAVVVRTARAAGILAHRAGTGVGVERFHVVANARNENIFRPPSSKERGARRSALGLNEDQPLLVYTGSSLVGKYRGEAIFRFLREVRAIRSDARLLLLMPLHEEAHELMASNPDIAAACIVRSADPHEVAGWLGAADLGIALIHATFSMQAVAAIKLGEYLLCGLPVLASAGVGDTDTIIGSSVGRCLVEPDEQSLASAAHWFVNTVLPDRVGFEQRCRANGLANFSLDSAVRDYGDALRAALEARLGG
jgi:glycosyltransferase involved in cell wall biosynthesis